MSVFAIADLHLSFGVEGKEMDVFGPRWEQHYKKIAKGWRRVVKEDDLVLVPGDISWALHPEDAIPDLQWIDELPGTKILSRGNHDLWWRSRTKVQALLPSSIQIIHNDAIVWNDIGICGTRLWETPDVDFTGHIDIREAPKANVREKIYTEEEIAHDAAIYTKELERLKLSIAQLPDECAVRIAMLHYPPIGPNHEPNAVTRILDEAHIDFCVFGHVHNLLRNTKINTTIEQTHYVCVPCDFLEFVPYKLNI